MTRYRWGVTGGHVISHYNAYRPGAYAQTRHKGEDVGCTPGVAVKALASGRVHRVRDYGSVSGYVQEVTIYYPSVAKYVLYGHVQRGVPVRVGQAVQRGQLIARCGTISDASGGVPSRGVPAHIHVQVWQSRVATDYYNNNAAINPEPVRRALGELRASGGGGGSCTHSYGGTYADKACSAGYQCCDGNWRSRGTCGTCACVERSGETGCRPKRDCEHSFGGDYGHRACSPSYQCCDGRWRDRGSCGNCTCTESTGERGCGA